MKGSVVNAVPERLHVNIGGHFGTSFSVCLEDGLLTYESSKLVQNFPPKWDCRSEQIQPTEGQWQAFRERLDELNVWRWESEYFEPVCDGTGWSAEIVYSEKAIRSHGSNCFPGQNGRAIPITVRREDDTFEQFCRAVSMLLERDFQ
jgi:hypothetical protein